MGMRHLTALHQQGVEVVAVSDILPDRLEEAKRVCPGANGYPDWRQLLEREQVDLACVATTAPSHAAIVIGAADAGVSRILCEKPLATNLESGRQMLSACRTAGTRLAVNYSRRRFPPYRHIEQHIACGTFGDVRFMRATCGAAGLANGGTHAFDLMRWFLGPAVAVTGFLDPRPLPNARGSQFVDPGGHGAIEFSDGRRATFDFTADFSSGFVVEFGCRFGRVLVREQDRSIEASARPADARNRPLNDYSIPPQDVPLAFSTPVDIVAMTAAMIDNILSEEPPACTGEDALGSLEVTAAVHISHHDGHRRVQLPLEDDRGTLSAIA
jgi:myo-inositol 2-dehydrogenase / D-chiro-inositol 1-dehydrogenase